MSHRIAASLVATIALVQLINPALAGQCAKEVDAFRHSLRQQHSAVGTAPQSVDAQLGHQPTAASIASAERQAKSELEILLDQAKALDAQGKHQDCADALAKAKLLANP
jgi:hypothetical protein